VPISDQRREIAAKHIHAARCNACGGAPRYSGEHRRPVSQADLQAADALLAELDALATRPNVKPGGDA
jgi:hypothetical protein